MMNLISSGRGKVNTKKPTPNRSTDLPTDSVNEHKGFPIHFDTPVTQLLGVSQTMGRRLRRLNIETVRDLLYLFPRRHNDLSHVTPVSNLVAGVEQTVIVTIWEARVVILGKKKATEATVGDETGNIRVVWFNQPFLAKTLRTNNKVALSGRVEIFSGRRMLVSPEYDFLDRKGPYLNTARLIPVYPLTGGITQRTVRRFMAQALKVALLSLKEFLPPNIQNSMGLLPLQQAVSNAHFPHSNDVLNQAHLRLAFDELFLVQTAVLQRRMEWESGASGVPLTGNSDILQSFLASLPFSLTKAQNQALTDILSDMKRGTPPMSRLLQGDVGSGKTVVALVALLATATMNHQGALMAPTEILAEQHFDTVYRLLSNLAHTTIEDDLLKCHIDSHTRSIGVALLIGGMSIKQKTRVRKRIENGEVDIIIGTHALVQEDVLIPRLALAVVDEQHRFGVMQRAALRQKGRRPHVLAMSATPIPRTLVLTLYGDLDLSVLSELPAGRQEIKTRWVSSEKRLTAYKFIEQQIEKGRQAFVICPLIEESELIDTKAATQEYQRLSGTIFPNYKLGLLHGRLSTKQKDEVMRRFRDHELDILVSTSVVEVGIDVPNATVMLVEGADRFGLAQLHQFRGRVGRGEHRSYCLLLANSPSPDAQERLSAVEHIRDGFELAEVDLRLRGPGDFFGTRQSGLPDLKMARLSDHALLELARKSATSILEKDPTLDWPEHRPLASQVARFLGNVTEESS